MTVFGETYVFVNGVEYVNRAVHDMVVDRLLDRLNDQQAAVAAEVAEAWESLEREPVAA